jgi:hypothetical protein
MREYRPTVRRVGGAHGPLQEVAKPRAQSGLSLKRQQRSVSAFSMEKFEERKWSFIFSNLRIIWAQAFLNRGEPLERALNIDLLCLRVSLVFRTLAYLLSST